MMAAVPNSFRRLMVTKVSQKFRECVAVQTVNTPALKDSEVLVKTRYLGINASDINFSAGRLVMRMDCHVGLIFLNIDVCTVVFASVLCFKKRLIYQYYEFCF